MQMSLSSEAANSAASPEFPNILWNSKVYYRVYNSHPLVLILSQITPVHNTPSYLSLIHYKINHPSTSWSLRWFLFFWLSHQYPQFIPLLPLLGDGQLARKREKRNACRIFVRKPEGKRPLGR
jgi:hypothetical protein